MNQLDVYYRALLGYRQLTVANNECTAQRTAIAEADAEQDKIEITRAFCTIDEDWVNAIEAGLVHVEKAIKEERQFIRSNGEVVPIEKVKHVSKESVEHLAKHSNLITRYEEGEDIIPEKLYTVERLNEYAVYENRFLYMLLCYLRDFVTLRYNNILDLTHKYDATLEIDKKINTGRQKMSYKLSMHDVRRDDPYLKEHNPTRAVIDRIDLILKAILAFLATPLMEIVAKAPMLKPPITKTNVLKMNNNFKGAVALYDYIVAYDKTGYTVEIDKKTLSPFKAELADELAEAGALISFLTYEHGLGMKAELKDSYAAYQEEQRKLEIKKREEQIAALKRRVHASGEGMEEYILLVEKQLRALEGERTRADALEEQVASLEQARAELSEKIVSLNGEITNLNEEMEAQRVRHFEEIENLKTVHEDQMHELVIKHEEKLFELREEAARVAENHMNELSAIREEAEKAIDEARRECDEAVANAKARSAEAIDAMNKKNAEYETLLEAKRLCEARIKALGGVNRDYTDRDSFNELEAEYNAFVRIYKDQWAKTKKQIRKNHLNMKNIKGQTEQSKDSD